MNKLIQKFLANKKLVKILAALLVVVIASGIYMYNKIELNVEKMLEAADEEITYYPAYPAINAKSKDLELIKRGEYLAKAGDCIACHTNTQQGAAAKSFAGGLAMNTPFGTIYSPNITPDKETGIGGWTDEQFIKAMRHGISPKGSYYYPAFPYYYFSKVTTEDLKAIKAYLDSTPAVSQQNRKNEMVGPFNQRFLQLGWRILFFNRIDTGPFKPDPRQSEKWNRGAYLVEGLGHCAMCHSPSYYIVNDKFSLGAPIRKYNLSGAKIQSYLAPNISKANLEKITEEEIVQVFTEDRLIGGGKIEGPMLEVNHNSLKHLTRTDLFAIAHYLKSVQSTMPPKPKGGVAKYIYDNYCSGCHTAGAGGAPKYGDASDWEPLLKHGMDSIYMNAIKGKGGMPAKGTCLSCNDDDIKQAVDYMIASTKGKMTVKVQKPKKLTLADGKRIYEANCSVCHSSGFKNAPQLNDKKAWQPSIDAGFVPTYLNVLTGRKGHPPNGGCGRCSDLEIKTAIKYILTQQNPEKNYELW